MNFKAGQTIGAYKLLELCGSGAYGNVFYAENTMTHQFYALKILNSSETINERELRGLMNYRNCRHPNLLQIHHIDKIDGVIYYTMDAADNAGNAEHYIPDTLSHRLSLKKTLSAAEILQMANELLDGLSYLHKHGLVHRDIKPDNILWIDGKATLADIGLTSPQKNASLVGTPDFMSDDLLRGRRSATPEDDLYSLGKVIYCALTGCSAKEYPHYPADVTISDAAQIIRAYTTVCDSPSPIKSSEEMKTILNQRENIPESRHSKRSVKTVLAVSFCGILVILLLLWYLKCNNLNLPAPSQRAVTEKSNLPKKKIEKHTLPNNIISELELVYLHRNTPRIEKTKKKAELALKKLDMEVEQKKAELNSRKITKKIYDISLKAITDAREEHIRHDPLCRYACLEKQIEEFLIYNRSGDVSEKKIRELKELLDKREIILYEIENNPSEIQKERRF